MDDTEDANRHRGRSRRRILAATGTALGAVLAGCGGNSGDEGVGDATADTDEPTDDTATAETTRTPTTDSTDTRDPPADDEFPPLGNYPVEGDRVTYGFVVSPSGPFGSLGEAERRGYELAVTHLNDGGGWADAWDDLRGDGVLGRTVEATFADPEMDPNRTHRVAVRLLREDDAILLSGGISTAVAIVTQRHCQAEKVQYMAALSHSNVTTGSECARYAFREMHNVEMGTRGLVATLADRSDAGTVSVLYPDYAYGNSVQEATTRLFGERGWSTGATVAAPLGVDDYSDYLDSIPRASDVLVLSEFGPSAATMLRQATEMGFAEDTTLVVPLMEDTFLDAAGPELAGVYGTVDWHWSRDERYSNLFTDAYTAQYGEPPASAARLAYAATMRYSAAVERAGTFYPPEVVRAMEGHEYANTGIGRATARACDHQSMRSVYVVEGHDPETADSPVGIVATQGPETVGYSCDEPPASECDLGDYE